MLSQKLKPRGQGRSASLGSFAAVLLLGLVTAVAAPSEPIGMRLIVAAGDDPAQPSAQPADDSPEAKMSRRFPQKVRVADLIGLPMLDDNDVTLGAVRQVVRTPDGKIQLIVSYSRWFGWFGRPVAVPIEAVAILARQIASLDMQPEEYEKAPTWSDANARPISDNEIIRIAITRR